MPITLSNGDPLVANLLDIICFLIFNVASVIGNCFALLCFKCCGSRGLVATVLIRTIHVPLFMFCNFKPDERNTPVLFKGDPTADIIHGVLSALLGWSNGYLLPLLMGKLAEKSMKERLDVGLAMKLGAVMINGGVALGIFLGMMLVKLATL